MVIDKEGKIERRDNNGNTFSYLLNDIESADYDMNGFRSMILTLKSGKASKTQIEGKKSESPVNVIAFTGKSNCNLTIEIFKEFNSLN